MVFFYLFNKQITLNTNQDKERQHQNPQLEVSNEIKKRQKQINNTIILFADTAREKSGALLLRRWSNNQLNNQNEIETCRSMEQFSRLTEVNFSI